MLDEGRRRRARGTDVVVAHVDTHRRARTAEPLGDLEVVPPRNGMDLAAVLRRRPAVALVDDLAHTNPPGSEHETRADDVRALLDAGIDVITTVNVQHLESLNDVVEKITGVPEPETVPDAFVRAADQIELVDMDPAALRRRMAHGNIYAPEDVDAALADYFRIGNLTALRELALLWVADRVDESLQDYLATHGIAGSWETRERVVVAVGGAPSGGHVIRRAARMAARTKGELLGVHVRATDGFGGTGLLDAHRRLLEDLGGTYHEVVGSDVAAALTSFAEAERATQLVLGASRRSRVAELLRGSVINAVARRAGSFDVHVISHDTDGDEPSLLRPRPRPVGLSARRRATGWVIAVVGVPLVTVALIPGRDELELSANLMAFLMLVVVASTVGGFGPGISAAVAGSVALSWYFAEPLHTLTVSDPENALALAGFLVVGGVISFLVTQAARRTLASSRAASEAEALARVAGGLLGSDDPLPAMLDRFRSTFGLSRAAVEVRDPATQEWREESMAGGGPGPDRERGRPETVPLGADARLALYGPPLAAEDLRVVHAFVAQLTSALEKRRLRAEASAAVVTAESDALRTALLRAVSHDLRTPLASIKASVSSLLQHDIEWEPDATKDFLETIDEETDRLNALVGNLLDMSRLETGAVQVTAIAVGWEEVVAGALASLSEPTDLIEVNVPESLPRIAADPVLLERSVANMLSNALRHTPAGTKIWLEAGAVGDRVDLRLIDTGPGVTPERIDQMYRAFQRLGDRSHDGVGLGLAVARGFVEAMGGELDAEATPGGGLTMVIRMPAVPS
jgi:two-component system sensor histidine kinase KdpD